MSDTRDAVWKNQSVVNRYLEGIRGAIPLAAEQIDLLLRLLAFERPRELGCFLDLGCGDGVLARAVLDRFPASSGVLLDFSEPMLARARELAPASARVAFINADYGRAAWIQSLPAPGRFDAIVSGFSIHHQPDERKRELYGELFELLNPGGIFLNLEHVSSSSSWGRDVFDEYFVDALHAAHCRAREIVPRSMIAEQYHGRTDEQANILAPVETQCGWLRELGFERVDCYFKVLELALFGGVKPRGAG